MKTVRITIPFHDKPLVLIDHHEQPFVAMRPIVDGMGIDWKSQQRKLNKRFTSTDGRKRAIETGRSVPVDVFAEAHVQPRRFIKMLSEGYNDKDRVRIRAIWNDGDGLQDARLIPIEEIPDVSQDQAERAFRSALDRASLQGHVHPRTYAAFAESTRGNERANDDRSSSPGGQESTLDTLNQTPLSQNPAASGVFSSSEQAEFAAIANKSASLAGNGCNQKAGIAPALLHRPEGMQTSTGIAVNGAMIAARKRHHHIPLDTIPRPAHNARVAATSATGFSRLNTRRVSRRMTVFLCPKSANASRYGVVAGEALGLAGFLCRSANPCRHAAIWNSSQSAAFTTQEVPS